MLVEIVNIVNTILEYGLKGIVSILLFIIGFIIHNPSMNLSTNDIHQFNNYVSYWFENINELNPINELAYIIGWSFLYIIGSIIAIIIICIIHTKIFKQ